MTDIDPNLWASLARQYSGGVAMPVTGQAGYLAIVNDDENNFTFVPAVQVLSGVDAIGRAVYVAARGEISTLADAIDEANVLNPSETSPVLIKVLDAGVYTAGGLTLPSGVTLDARAARIEGSGSPSSAMFTVSPGSALLAGRVVPQWGQNAVTSEAAGSSRVEIDRVDTSGGGGAILCASGAGPLHCWIRELQVGAGSYGIGNDSNCRGDIFASVGDIYLGDSAIAVARDNAGTTFCTIGRISETAAATGFFADAGGTITGFAAFVSVSTPTDGGGSVSIQSVGVVL